jgi:hypothetical protein
MDQEATIAGLLGTGHIGCRFYYGPALCFSGEIAEVKHLAGMWLEGDDLHPVPAPTRTFVRTTDGRCATVVSDALVRVEHVTAGVLQE